jgi:hypothetical protein
MTRAQRDALFLTVYLAGFIAFAWLMFSLM